MTKAFLLLGSLNAGLCVILGAFGAHKLKSVLSESALATFHTGVQYHFYHSLALILLGLLIVQLNPQEAYLRYSGYAFVIGIILFSGSLYGLALTQWKVLGPITPLGGLSFIVAWGLMAWGLTKAM